MKQVATNVHDISIQVPLKYRLAITGSTYTQWYVYSMYIVCMVYAKYMRPVRKCRFLVHFFIFHD
jgi:hypothetical protein